MTLGVVMAAEMAEQPPGSLICSLVLTRLLAVCEVLPDPLAGTVLIARGSSDHAATTDRNRDITG